MRRIKECLRLYHEAGMNQSQLSRALSLARSTVQDYLKRFAESDLSWTAAQGMSDEALEKRLFCQQSLPSRRMTLDFEYLYQELKRPGVTLQLLWEEYRREHPNGYSYSQFCNHYRSWKKKLKTWMRQHHVGGEKVFADYSGKKPVIVNPITGEVQQAELFVMSWGASHYLYAEAQPSQEIAHWIAGHVHAFEYFGCVPKFVVPDNLKSAVTKACRYDPDVNRSYTELADHYKFGVLPARPVKPKDKAKVENGVLIVQRWILARLRNRIFHSLAELNGAIRELLEEANQRPMQLLKKNRRQLFEELDKPNALALPTERYSFSQWRSASCGFDYHVQVEKHYYTVPYQYYGKQLDVRFNERVVEFFYNRQRIALHRRNFKQYGYTTLKEHLPPRQQKHLQWTPARLINWAAKIGPNTNKLIVKIIEAKRYPEQGYRPALGVLQLTKNYNHERLENAAAIALRYNRIRVGEIRDILKKGVDLQPQDHDRGTVQNVDNVRGPAYYKQKAGEK
jgi:transposase